MQDDVKGNMPMLINILHTVGLWAKQELISSFCLELQLFSRRKSVGVVTLTFGPPQFSPDAATVAHIVASSPNIQSIVSMIRQLISISLFRLTVGAHFSCSRVAVLSQMALSGELVTAGFG